MDFNNLTDVLLVLGRITIELILITTMGIMIMIIKKTNKECDVVSIITISFTITQIILIGVEFDIPILVVMKVAVISIIIASIITFIKNSIA